MRRAKPTSPTHQRDTIESWLDVLVSMLKLPSAQREQIRDELEDHLRSRVDDLLIMGKPEPEAIQTAIHELGETAELAKRISTASHTRAPFRRFAMNATFFVLAGSILTASVSMMMPTSSTTSAIEYGPASTQSAADSEEQIITAQINVRDVAISDVVHEIADTFGVSVEFASDVSEMISRSSLSLDLDGVYSLEQALDSVLVACVYGNSRPYVIDGDKVVFTKLQSASAVPTEVRTYTLDWSNEEAAINVFETVYQVVGGGSFDSGLFAARFVANMLVVKATAESHRQIEQILADAKIAYEDLVNEESVKQQVAIDRIRTEYEAAKREYIAKSNEANQLKVRERQLQLQADQAGLGSEQYDDAQAELADLSGAMQVLELETREMERRYETLQSLLLEAESDQLRSELN